MVFYLAHSLFSGIISAMKKLFLLTNLCFVAFELHLLANIKHKSELPQSIPPVYFFETEKSAPLLEEPQEDQASAVLIELIKEREGFSSKPYYCPAGKLTIGYGFTDSKYVKRKSMTEKQAHDILVNEIIPSYSAKVNSIVKVPLSAFQHAALVSFCYNCGEENLRRLVSGKGRLNSGNYQNTPSIMKKYVKADGKTLKGLVIRRNQEASLFLADN